MTIPVFLFCFYFIFKFFPPALTVQASLNPQYVFLFHMQPRGIYVVFVNSWLKHDLNCYAMPSNVSPFLKWITE